MKELAERWLEALRGGEYRQCRNVLKEAGSYCCLGVLCELSGAGKWVGSERGDDALAYYASGWKADYYPHDAVLREAGLSHALANRLSDMNDSGESFLSIARYAEEALLFQDGLLEDDTP